MKVFVSSTCYDLLDVRAELCETLRGMDATPVLSDDKGSAFYVPSEPDVNSIEACLANVREADLVLLVLSQRYGPPLGGRYGELSATHCEYREAVELKRPLRVYVRAQLAGEFSAWAKNGRSPEFKTAWTRPDDAQRLFALLDGHHRLHRADARDANNWYTTFNSSVDLCAAVEQQLSQQVRAATIRQQIDAGRVPIVVPTTQSVIDVWEQPGRRTGHVRFTFDVVNAGTVAAVGATGNLTLGGGTVASGPGAKVGVVLPGGDRRQVQIDVRRELVDEAYRVAKERSSSLSCRLVIGYVTPSGARLADVSLLELEFRNNEYAFADAAAYLGKAAEGITSFLLDSPW